MAIRQFSAGGVALKELETACPEIALIKTSAEGRWQLPKGLIDPGETAQEAALREVREEAGIVCEIVDEIGEIEYFFVSGHDGPGSRYHKKVTFYLMRYLSGDLKDHDDEVLEAVWIDLNGANDRLSFDSERGILAKVMLKLGNQPDGGSLRI